jgi:hypothetical protein
LARFSSVWIAKWVKLILHGCLRPIIASSGLAYRLDLFNEGIPDPSQPVAALQYVQRLWIDYTSRFGKADTVGFSVISDNDRRVRQFPTVYNGNFPNVFDFHFYENAYSNFSVVHQACVDLGLPQSWILGEAFYDDAQEAKELKQVIRDTGQTVLFLTQWIQKRRFMRQNCPALTNTAYYNNVQNPIDDAQFFARQHYLDILNREPEQGGLAFWSGQIVQCGSDANCLSQRRIGVSHAF